MTIGNYTPYNSLLQFYQAYAIVVIVKKENKKEINMSPETPQTDRSEFIIPPMPENLLPAETETQPEEQAVEMISIPEDIMTPELTEAIEARGRDASEVHINLGAQAIAQHRILENQAQFEQASAVATEAAKVSQENSNIEG